MRTPTTITLLCAGTFVSELVTALVLSWPLSAAGFVLEMRNALATNIPWAPSSNGITIQGRQFIRSARFLSPTAFFGCMEPISLIARINLRIESIGTGQLRHCTRRGQAPRAICTTK